MEQGWSFVTYILAFGLGCLLVIPFNLVQRIGMVDLDRNFWVCSEEKKDWKDKDFCVNYHMKEWNINKLKDLGVGK